MMCAQEVRKSTLMNAFMHVDEETDINRVMDFFRYLQRGPIYAPIWAPI